MITKNERIATKAYERLVKPMMERYNESVEMSHAIDFGEFSTVDFPDEEHEALLQKVASRFGMTSDRLFTTSYMASEEYKEHAREHRVWIDPAGGTHVGFEDPAAMYA